MISEISNRKTEIAELCRNAHVHYLALVGSATGRQFNPQTSDVDFLVEFEDLPPAALAEAYFILKEGLETLLGRPVDLITRSSIANPYLLRDLESTREELYAA